MDKSEKEILNEKIAVILDKISNGDIDAFGEIYDIFLKKIYSFVFFKVSNEEVAEDLTEDIFLKAFMSIKKYEKKDNIPFTAWLYRIASNTVIDYYRTNKVTFSYDLDFEKADERALDDIKIGVETSFNQKILKKGLAELNGIEKDLIIFKYINQMEYSEISPILQKTPVSLRQTHSRALKKLKGILERYF